MGHHKKFTKWKLDCTKRNSMKRRIEEADKTIQEEIRKMADEYDPRKEAFRL